MKLLKKTCFVFYFKDWFFIFALSKFASEHESRAIPSLFLFFFHVIENDEIHDFESTSDGRWFAQWKETGLPIFKKKKKKKREV